MPFAEVIHGSEVFFPVEIELSQARWGQSRPNGRQVLTGSHDMDGFYYALLQRAGA